MVVKVTPGGQIEVNMNRSEKHWQVVDVTVPNNKKV